MTVHRTEPLGTIEIDIDISKKSGKETGFSYIECKDYGILVTEIVRIIIRQGLHSIRNKKRNCKNPYFSYNVLNFNHLLFNQFIYPI